MSVQVTLKLSAKEFDQLRRAVEFAQKSAREKWESLKVEGKNHEAQQLLIFEDTCRTLLKNPLS